MAEPITQHTSSQLTIPLGQFDPIRGSLTLLIECGEFDFALVHPGDASFSVPVGPSTATFQSGIASAGFGSIRYTNLDVDKHSGRGIDHFLQIQDVNLVFNPAQQQAFLNATVFHEQLGATRIVYTAYLVIFVGGILQTSGGSQTRKAG